jgi:SAM-dependent methyltransferase
MILTDVRRFGPRPTILDIGCGGGLDGSLPLQQSLAEAAGRFIGIEPDPDVCLGDHFTESHRCLLEGCPLEPGSVDVAYAVMVLEHLPHPQAFWDKLHEVLADGGVFWGMTVDARHLFCRLSLWAGRLQIKELYLKRVLGETPEEGRYRNYRTYYRCNTPRQISRLALGFRCLECVNFSRVGQWGAYLPRPLRPISDWIDRRAIRKGRPGSLLIIRAEK